jgi:hypothetical protein
MHTIMSKPSFPKYRHHEFTATSGRNYWDDTPWPWLQNLALMPEDQLLSTSRLPRIGPPSCVKDNPYCNLPTETRLQMLRDRELAWSNPQPELRERGQRTQISPELDIQSVFISGTGREKEIQWNWQRLYKPMVHVPPHGLIRLHNLYRWTWPLGVLDCESQVCLLKYLAYLWRLYE